MNARLLFPLVLASIAAAAAPVRASESYDNCTGFITSLPTTISTQGVWCLKGDLATGIASGNAITLDANNVTLDCNDFKIGGLSAGIGTMAHGVSIPGRANAVVRRCNIRGFYFGIEASNAGSGHLIEENRLAGNTYVGINAPSSGSTVRRNLVIDTGGSTVSTPDSYGIAVAFGVDVLENSVDGVSPTAGGGAPVGIAAAINEGGTISGNRIRGLVPPEGGGTYGIRAGSVPSIVEGNFLYGSASNTDEGVFCLASSISSIRNAFVRIEHPVTTCLSSDDVVNPN